MKTASKLWGSSLASALLALAAPSCGGETETTGTDSNTHWLARCDEDSDCGNLQCLCGFCSAPCDSSAACSSLGSSALCAELGDCAGAPATSACTQGCSLDGECLALGPGGVCRQGHCEIDSTIPVDGECAPLDARANGTLCGGIAGYTWTGKQCAPVNCGCTGSECDRLFPTMDACDRAYSACYAESGFTRECTVHADCALVTRGCCASCGQPSADSQFAVRADSINPERLSLCFEEDPLCPECPSTFNPSLYAACVDGQCSVLDLGTSAVCTTDDDCRVETKTCCACQDSFAPQDLVAVSSDYTECGFECEECAVPFPGDVGSTCDSSGVCALLLPQ